MNKIIYFLFIYILIGCSEINFVEDISEYPIEFYSETNKPTRVGINSTEDIADNGGFDVYGYKINKYTNDWYTLFNKVNIVYTDNKWTYSPVQYWNNFYNYIFYAAAPHSDNISIIYLDDKKIERYIDEYPKDKLSIKISDVYSGKGSEVIDYLIIRNPVIRTNNTYEPVVFDFHHILTKVVVKFKTDIDNCRIKVTSLKFTGWLNEKHNFKQDINYNGNSISEWYINEKIIHYNKAGEGTFDLEDKEFGRNIEGLPTELEVKDYWLMIPQIIGPKCLKFIVDYTITYSDGIIDTFKNIEGIVDFEHYWYTDNQITYTLTISPEPIKFNVTNCEGYIYKSSTIILK